MAIQLWEDNTYLPDALIGEIQVVLDMFQHNPNKPLELIQVYSFRHQITRVKLKMNYRPKALIEAQRAPVSQQRGSAMVPVPLTNSTNTARQATNSPSRALSLNSKVVTPAELKEFIEILDFGLMETLRAPDVDQVGGDPVWDWGVSTSSLGGATQPSIPRENRYSAMPHVVDQTLPIFMRPISLDIGLPPSTTTSSASQNGTSYAFGGQKSDESPRKVDAKPIEQPPVSRLPIATNVNKSADLPNANTESTRMASTYGIDPDSIRHELAIRAISPRSNLVEPSRETSASVRLSEQIPEIYPPAILSTSPPFNAAGISKATCGEAPTLVSPRLQGSITIGNAREGSTSPRSDASLSPSRGEASEESIKAQNIPDASPTTPGSPNSLSPRSLTPTTTNLSQTASNGGDPAAWMPTIAPSESVLEAYLDEPSKTMQSLGNAARERRRNRRPTYDAQHPPEFKGLEALGLQNSAREHSVSMPLKFHSASSSASTNE